jgi:hypothetical protein
MFAVVPHQVINAENVRPHTIPIKQCTTLCCWLPCVRVRGCFALLVAVLEQVQLTIKCNLDRYAEMEAFIKANHPYTTPQIVATPITHGSAEYLDWLRTSTTTTATQTPGVSSGGGQDGSADDQLAARGSSGGGGDPQRNP